MNSNARATGLLACSALSGGIHLGLVPEHLSESVALGMGFLLSGLLLIALGLGAFLRPGGRHPLALAALLGGLIVAYAVSRTAGLPLLHPAPEAVDALGLATKGIEVLAMTLALQLYGTNSGWLRPPHKLRSNQWTPISQVRRAGS